MRYIGCKTQLLENIEEIINRHAIKSKSFCDIFSGTATVGRYFKKRFEIQSNDVLFFSYCLQMATIENPKKPTFDKIKEICNGQDPILYINNMDTEAMSKLPIEKRYFQNNYSPNGGRMYVTDTNALRIDYSRNCVEDWHNDGLLDCYEYYYLLASIVEGIPFVSNISGTYGAYNKKWDVRSKKKFELIDLPVVENGKNNKCYNEDGVELLDKINGDILYIDPPYNKRQYLPNYHLLETAAKYDYPQVSGVTGVRRYGINQKSDFCSEKKATVTLEKMIRNANFRHIIFSYNTDGIMSISDIVNIMKNNCIPESVEINYIDYRRYKSKKNITNESNLKEILIYAEKQV